VLSLPMKMTFFCWLGRCGRLLHFSQAKILTLKNVGSCLHATQAISRHRSICGICVK
jgi:hypothetical protein